MSKTIMIISLVQLYRVGCDSRSYATLSCEPKHSFDRLHKHQIKAIHAIEALPLCL